MSSLRSAINISDRASSAAIGAAAFVTVLDGFDAFSLSLMAPRFSAELGIPASALGGIFAAAMGGMIIGALTGGALADKFGRLAVLLCALTLFGVAALTMPFVGDIRGTALNRFVAGVGLGSAAPIAVALLTRSARTPPSELVLAMVWSGIGIGGVIAAAYNYLVVPILGWRAMFVFGGVMPLPAAIIAFYIFRRTEQRAPKHSDVRPRLRDLLSPDIRNLTIMTGMMFLFGYVATSVIVYWLPTILHHRNTSAFIISMAFAGLNIGGFVGTVLLGYIAKRGSFGLALPLAWFATGVFGFASAVQGLSDVFLALAAVSSAALAAGSQAISVAFVARRFAGRELESTAIGLMVGMGRIGQMAALSLTGILLALGLPETGLFAVAGAAAFVAALIALIFLRPKAPPPAALQFVAEPGSDSLG